MTLIVSGTDAVAHGGVSLDGDQCVIEIGYFRAHFKVYLPQEHRHQDYCEDLPDAGDSVFVMEYLHAGLSNMTIDFRIIENVTAAGRFARWPHVAQIEDLEAATVFYAPPVVEPDVYRVAHRFETGGGYIGIVTATDPQTGSEYKAVFPFSVGFTGLGYWPWFVGLILIVQLNYSLATGQLARIRRRFAA